MRLSALDVAGAPEVLPPIPGIAHGLVAPMAGAGRTVSVYVVDTVAATDPVSVLVAIWGAGAVVFLAWHVARYWRFCRRLLATAETLDEREGIRVIVSTAAQGPLAFGIMRRFVVFPGDIASRYDAQEQALALAHEIGHHRRGDLIANWIALVLLALHWFNPVAWAAFRAFRADQELANDAGVLAGRPPAERHAYARAIVKAAHGGAISVTCHLHTITDLKGRLRMLTVSPASRRRLATGTAAVALMVTAGLGLTASRTQAAAAIGSSISAGTQAVVAPPAPLPVPNPVVGTTRPGITSVTTKDGKTVRTRIVRVRDRATADAIVAEKKCDDGNGAQRYEMPAETGRKRIIILCTNQVKRSAEDSAVTAIDSEAIERDALASAMTGLTSARASISGNTAMSTEQRKEALAGIDKGIAEIRAQMAKPN